MTLVAMLALTLGMAGADTDEFFFDRTCAVPVVVSDSIRFSDAGYLPETGTSEEGTTVNAIRIDLNNDGAAELIVPSHCTPELCRYPIFDGVTKEFLGEVRGDRILVTSRRWNGFAVLEAYAQAPDESGILTTFAYDGKAYTRRSSDLLTKSGAAAAAKRFEDAERCTGGAEE